MKIPTVKALGKQSTTPCKPSSSSAETFLNLNTLQSEILAARRELQTFHDSKKPTRRDFWSSV